MFIFGHTMIFTNINNITMSNILKASLVLLLFGSIALSECKAQDLKPISFNNIPQWIEEHIEFPAAASYGTEQFCLSATWDGRVFLTSRPYTLDPACEQAIIEAVKSAPRCYFEGDSAEDIFKNVTIDFARSGSSVGLHSVPIFKHESTGPFNGRNDFAAWAAQKYKMPKELKKGDFADTLSVRYQIDNMGCVKDVMISECAMPEVESSLKKLLLDSPQWKPALAENRDPIDMTLEDIWILKSVKGKAEIELLVDPVYCNDAPAPNDPSVIVMNPEVSAECLDGNFYTMVRERLLQTNTKAINCYFVVETDGKTGGITVEASEKEIGEQIAEFIAGTNWKPATQQGVSVRSLRTFAVAGVSGKTYTHKKNYPEDFGRHYVYLTTPPYTRNKAYMQSDGSYSKYPFNAQGQFDHKEYQNQQIRAAKNSATGSHNFTKNYNSQLKRRYTK